MHDATSTDAHGSHSYRVAEHNVSRKRKACTVSEEVNAVERVDKGESQAKVLRYLSVSESTLRVWLKDKEKLRK